MSPPSIVKKIEIILEHHLNDGTVEEENWDTDVKEVNEAFDNVFMKLRGIESDLIEKYSLFWQSHPYHLAEYWDTHEPKSVRDWLPTVHNPFKYCFDCVSAQEEFWQ